MKTTKILLSLVLFLLIGCTAVTPTEEMEETAVPPENAIPEEAPMNEADTPETEPISQPDPTPTDEDKQVSEPVTVDLSDVTPVPMNETPVVQPAPGQPNNQGDKVDQAIADLNQRVGVPVAEIEVVSLLEVTWPDGSIGCPQSGELYTQALVAGQQLILRANGTDYYYHSGRGSEFIYCSTPQPPLEDAPVNPLQPIPGQND
ncbi:MAG: hypothetical protein R3D55_29385 [Chloroflexota bacterium]